MLNYVTQLNLFEHYCTGLLPIKAQLIYYKLFKYSNRFGLGNPFRLTNQILMLETGILNEKTLIENRNLLKEYGFIEFETGKKNSPTQYVLTDLTKYTFNLQGNIEVNTTVNDECTCNLPVNNTVKTEVNTTVNNESLQSNNYLNKNGKQKLSKEKNTKKEDPNFEKFWEEYPKKKSKGAARKAFENAIKKGITVDVLIDAVIRQRCGSQWTKDNGQYIPYPATWLNQERWEDEPDFTPVDAQQSCNQNKPKYNPNARNDVQAGYQGAMEMLEGLIDE